MEYKEFLEKIEETVQKKAGTQVKVIVSRALKTNRNYIDRISLLADGMNISPAIPLDVYYEQYRSGKSLDFLADSILSLYEESDRKGSADVSFYSDFEKVKLQIACKLINYEKNEELLRHVPHRRFHDLAIVYYCRTEHTVLGKGSILIQNDHLKQWNTDAHHIHEAAFFNTLRILPYRIYDIADILEESFGCRKSGDDTQHVQMYVLTNSEKYWGAVTIIYDSVLEKIAEKIGKDYFVLPSSIHECMIVPENKELKKEGLHQMVREINRRCVAQEDILGDSIYHYNMEKKELELVYGAEEA